MEVVQGCWSRWWSWLSKYLMWRWACMHAPEGISCTYGCTLKLWVNLWITQRAMRATHNKFLALNQKFKLPAIAIMIYKFPSHKCQEKSLNLLHTHSYLDSTPPPRARELKNPIAIASEIKKSQLRKSVSSLAQDFLDSRKSRHIELVGVHIHT